MDVTCLLIPDFAVALARRADPALRGQPVVIGGAPEEHAQVRACSAEARQAGVAQGMTLRRALGLCPGAVFLPWKEREVEDEAERITALLEEESPAVEVLEAGHWHCDTRGMARLANLEPGKWLRRLQERLRQESGLPLRLAAADTVFTAHAAATVASWTERSARAAEPLSITGDEAGEFLAKLPVEVLPVPAEMQQRLRLFGLTRLGDVAELPVSAIQAQFGADGVRARELALGHDESTVTPRREEVELFEESELPAPTPLMDMILAGTEALLGRALSRPAVRGYLLRRLDWEVLLESGERIERRVVFREPTNDARRMLFVLKHKIANLQLRAAAASLRIRLSGLCSEYGQQAPLWQTGPKRQRELFEAIDQLTEREGEPQVFRIVEVEPWSRIPERQLALMPFGR